MPSIDERLYLRDCRLIVSGEQGDGLDLSDLRVTFEITKGEDETPNAATIKVYNLAMDTRRQLRQEFKRVILQAGYKEKTGVIFDGTITQVADGQDGVDRVLTIYASDGDTAYNWAVVSTTLAAGSTPADHVAACQNAMGAHGVTGGHQSGLAEVRLPRAKVMHGPARKHLRSVTRQDNCAWSIQDGKLQILKHTQMTPNEAYELGSGTGLIGAATQNNDGIHARCLIISDITIGSRVVINQKDVLEGERKTPKQGAKDDGKLADIAADGAYKVVKAKYSGDTDGSDWYIDLILLDIDASVQKAKAKTSE